MKKIIKSLTVPFAKFILIILSSASFNYAQAKSQETDSIRYGGFGYLHLYKPTQAINNVIICVSGDGGWNEGIESIALKIKSPNTLLIGVDVRRVLKYMRESKSACLYPAANFEEMSQFVQKEMGYKTYFTPVLLGYSSGATLVYGLLAQAPQNTFRGAIVFGFCPDLEINKPLCIGSGKFECIKRNDNKGYDIGPTSNLSTPFISMQGNVDQICDYALTVAFLKKVSHAQVISLPKVGHGYTEDKNWVPQFKQAYAHLLTTTRDVPPPNEANMKIDLPIKVTEASGTATSDKMVLMISGDGGWTGFDQQIASEFASHGVPVVGLNSLKYFWIKKSPEQTAQDVLMLIDKYSVTWKKENIVLVGYSFGADVMPFIYNRLPENIKNRIQYVGLLSPSKDTDFEVHVSDLLNFGSSDRELKVPAEIEKMNAPHITCFFGKDEEDVPVNELPKQSCRVIILEGGHHYENSFNIVYKSILFQ
ncbi:virulence factor family protein [Mucilaginibacter agri]|uniref:Virulence factor family protein n=1 Tax=Mucilaginibacter agri TaxID=2695265 RepID=A0A965ZJ15_9SPHI|nr:virulence factor family protein [Mucilaginibacter agri]NCD72000.1 virulence factor family protein [Mucilaginibacter agri]